MLPKREGELKSAFGQELKRQLPDAVIMLFASAGMPDRAISWRGRTSFWEFKHGTPGFRSPGIQELMCCRLERQSFLCRYVVWLELNGVARTIVLRPSDLKARDTLAPNGRYLKPPQCATLGFDHEWLVGKIKEWHLS